MAAGTEITILTVRVALVLYVATLAARILGGRERVSRVLWTAGLLAYLAHVAAAFHWVHRWSHDSALEETARQTEELFGVASGSGLWFNYLFTLLWLGDVLWWWLDSRGYRSRPRSLALTIDGFFAFMFFNGAVVFATGPSRWIGVLAIPLLGGLWLWQRRR